jgi:hypothetical protein
VAELAQGTIDGIAMILQVFAGGGYVDDGHP